MKVPIKLIISGVTSLLTAIMSRPKWQKCPVCEGTDLTCETCMGRGVINRRTGKA